MRLKNYSYLLFGFTLLGYSCISPPENFPSTPEIEFSSLEYVGTPGQDSLLLSLNFKDAEGDLGLSATDINPPFNPLNYKKDAAGNFITYSRRPSTAPRYNPIDWVIDPIINNTIFKDSTGNGPYHKSTVEATLKSHRSNKSQISMPTIPSQKKLNPRNTPILHKGGKVIRQHQEP